MTDNAVVFFSVALRGLSVLAAIGGAVYLAHQGKDGWGWLIFLSVILGSYSIRSRADPTPQDPYRPTLNP